MRFLVLREMFFHLQYNLEVGRDGNMSQARGENAKDWMISDERENNKLIFRSYRRRVMGKYFGLKGKHFGEGKTLLRDYEGKKG